MDKFYKKELCPLEKKFGYVDNTVHPLNNWILMFCRDFCLPESLALGVFTVNNVQIAKTISTSGTFSFIFYMRNIYK